MAKADDEIKRAQTYALRGDVITARNILGSLVKDDPRNARAWVALSQVISDPEKEMYCLNRAYDIEPNNPQLQKMLNARLQMDKAQNKMQSALRLRQFAGALGSISWFLIILGCLLPCIVILVGALLTQN